MWCVSKALNCDSWYEELKLKLTLKHAVDFSPRKNTLCWQLSNTYCCSALFAFEPGEQLFEEQERCLYVKARNSAALH